jgi:hypothetical protein
VISARRNSRELTIEITIEVLRCVCTILPIQGKYFEITRISFPWRHSADSSAKRMGICRRFERAWRSPDNGAHDWRLRSSNFYGDKTTITLKARSAARTITPLRKAVAGTTDPTELVFSLSAALVNPAVDPETSPVVARNP